MQLEKRQHCRRECSYSRHRSRPQHDRRERLTSARQRFSEQGVPAVSILESSLRPDQRLRVGQDQPGPAARHPQLVVRRSEEAGDDQLPHLPSGKGRPVLRADLRTGKGLGMRLRQVPRHEVQGHDLRPLRREGHAQPRPPQADGPHRTGRAGRPHLVLQGHAQPAGQPAEHEDHQPGKGDLLPGLRGRSTRATRR